MIVDTDEIISTKRMCQLAGISVALLNQWVFRGKISPVMTIDGEFRVWLKSQLEDVLRVKRSSRAGRPSEKERVAC